MTQPWTPHPLTFEPILKPKVWGGRRLAQLNKPLPEPPEDNPIGESWELADLPESVEHGRSIIANGPLTGATLREAIEAHGKAILGHAGLSNEGGFPLLLKYLDARENLSVQVHPDEAYVQQHPEAHLKSEAWLVIDAQPPGLIYKRVKPDVTRNQFEAHLRSNDPQAVVDDLIAVPVQPGECHYLPSGTCHALGAGVMVAEVQTPSDTTFRVFDWGRTGRTLHIEQALQCIRFGEAPAGRRRDALPVRAGITVTTELLRTRYFHIERVDVEADGSFSIVTNEMPMIWMVFAGSGTLRTPGAENVTVRAGSTVLMPAALQQAQAELSAGTWLASITLPGPAEGLIA